jgi:hypothetical protein
LTAFWRLAGESLGELRDRFQGRPNFTLATGRPEGDEFFNADVLITDWSGSGLSFSYSRERPVLFIDIPRKVLNPEYERFANLPLEVTIRDKIGAVLSPARVAEAPGLVASLHDRRGYSISAEARRRAPRPLPGSPTKAHWQERRGYYQTGQRLAGSN